MIEVEGDGVVGWGLGGDVVELELADGSGGELGGAVVLDGEWAGGVDEGVGGSGVGGVGEIEEAREAEAAGVLGAEVDLGG